jgi:hypothetical protein
MIRRTSAALGILILLVIVALLVLSVHLHREGRLSAHDPEVTLVGEATFRLPSGRILNQEEQRR